MKTMELRPPHVRPARSFSQCCCFVGVALLLLAALLRWVVAPLFERLPADYVAARSYAGKARTHETPTSPEVKFESVIRRNDQTMTNSEGHAIIQGDLHWLTPAGVVIFETMNLYGVDRRSRENLPTYGNLARTGQYLFPPHTAKKRYGLWDPNYAGLGTATFERVDRFRGLEVYVFHFVVDGLDETAGFTSLPEVPAKYGALTYGQGRFWVEPVSGTVVDHEDSGASYFVNAKTGELVGEPIIQWSQRFTPETSDAEFQRASAMRWKMLALGVWLPLGFAVAGLVCITAGFRPRRGDKSTELRPSGRESPR